MESRMVCQIHSIPKVATGKAEDYHPTLKKRIKRIVSRRLSPRFKRQVKMILFEPAQWFRKYVHKDNRSNISIPSPVHGSAPLRSGDTVRVRSREEILATLDRWGQLRGCSFIGEMGQYCGTTQEVFKTVRRFVDERDQNVKRAKGVVLLKNVFCVGTQEFGSCDRSCLYFWREEWLEKTW